jgi:hypothetical protein
MEDEAQVRAGMEDGARARDMEDGVPAGMDWGRRATRGINNIEGFFSAFLDASFYAYNMLGSRRRIVHLPECKMYIQSCFCGVTGKPYSFHLQYFML